MKTLKYAWRFLMRSKSYTIINLLGLAFSLACSIILMRYIHRELTVDTHCIDREHVYAICTNTEGNRGLSGLKQYNYDTISIDNRFVEAMTTYIPLEKDYVISGTNRIYNPQNEMFRLLGTKRSFSQNETFFFRTPKHPLPCPFPLNFSLLIITKKFGNLAKNRYICIV